MRGSYVNSAVGRVALKRDQELCVVQAEICPEHKQNTANYQVSITINEDEEKIETVKCGCAASEGI